MKYLNQIIIIIVFIITQTGCSTSKKEEVTVTLSKEELCVQVKQLISQHEDNFNNIKGKRIVTPIMDIWETKYQLIGKSCQIWGWSDGKQTYMCSQTMPNKQAAIEKHTKAVQFSKQCLGSKWSVKNIGSKNKSAFRTIFSKPGLQTVASIHRVKTAGLFDSEWTVYYFIGDRDKSL